MKIPKTFFSRSNLFSSTLALLCAGAMAAENERRPDIVVFITDDHSHFDTEPYGSPDLRTPNMRRLAEAGMTFEYGYVPSPTCAPARASLLTGLMPTRSGAEPNHARADPDVKKWPAYFQELGYEVVALGKVAHYRHTYQYGFDHYAHDTFHDHRGIAAAAEMIENRDWDNDKPLCLMVGSNWPHVPWPQEFEGYEPDELILPPGSFDTVETRIWRARYAAAVTRADDDLGVVLDALEHAEREPLVLFSTDHGSQWPFGKWNLYEAGIRVPVIVAWPGVVEPGSRTDAMVNWIDFLPTLVEAAGGEPPDAIDGRSFYPVLRGVRDDHRDEMFATHSGDGRWNIYPMRSVREGNWKYIRNLHPEFAFTTHIDLGQPVDGREIFDSWVAAAETNDEAAAIVRRYHERPAEELYDLAADPGEQTNLADDPQFAARLEAMRARVEAWMRENDDEGRVYAEPRLLSDPSSYGPDAPPGN